MDATKRSLLLAVVVGFMAGCAVVYFIWPRGTPPAKASMPAPGVAWKQSQARAPHTQTENARKSPGTDGTHTKTQPAFSGAEARRVLSEIKRNKTADVSVDLFDIMAVGKKFLPSQQFINLFDLSSDEVGKLADLLQATKTEMWNAAKAQAQISRTETGGVVVKIPPLGLGPDIYDKVTKGFQTVLGDDRYNDMMLYNDNQLEQLFNRFGGEVRTITIEKTSDGRYNIKAHFMWPSSQGHGGGTMNMDEIKMFYPEYLDFIPAE